MSDDRPVRITVVGASIAGLTLAARLDPSRCEVTLVEARPGHREAGTALGLWPDLLPRLRALLPGLDELSIPVTGGRLLRPSGRVLVRSPPQRARLIPRPQLVGLLDAAVPTAVRRTTGRVERADDLLSSGTAAVELVVGADGVHSRIRPEVLRRPRPARSLGVAAVRGVVGAHLAEWTSETWGGRRLFGITPHSPGHTNWFCAYARAEPIEDAGPDVVLAELQERFDGHHPGVRAVLERLEPEGLVASTLWEVPGLNRYTGTVGFTDRSEPERPAALIGDAAHAMAPNLGRGACEAMLDAFALAEAIETTGYAVDRLPTALRSYDRARVRRSQLTRIGSKALLRTVLAVP